MRTNCFVWLGPLVATSLAFSPLPGWAAQAQPPEAASAVQELTGPSKTPLDARNWRLDPAVFTQITPFTAPDIAIELPLDQREEDLVPLPNPTPTSSAVPSPALRPEPSR